MVRIWSLASRRTLLVAFGVAVLVWCLFNFQDELLLRKSVVPDIHPFSHSQAHSDVAYRTSSGASITDSSHSSSSKFGVDSEKLTSRLKDNSHADSKPSAKSGTHSANSHPGVKMDAHSKDAKPGVKMDAHSKDAKPGVKMDAHSKDAKPGVKMDAHSKDAKPGVKMDAHSKDAKPGVKMDAHSKDAKPGVKMDAHSKDAKPGVKMDAHSKDAKPGVNHSERFGKRGFASDHLTQFDVSHAKKDTNASGNNSGVQQNRPTVMCPEKPPINETKVPLKLKEVTYEDLKRKFGHVMQHGGHYAPSTCKSRERVAVIIPYRDRQRNLLILLRNLIPFLIRQQTEFTVFVVEQSKDYLFNRCLMFNIGFVLSQLYGDFTCFVIHDTDLLPFDYRNLYRCADRPRHLVLSRTRGKGVEKLPYPSFIGGVLAVRKEHMEKSNGCSNSYYGWGLEDDDLEIRLKSHGFPVTRYPMEIGGYFSLSHSLQTSNDSSGKLRKTIRQRMDKEGLNTLNYTLLQQQQLELYTWFLVKPPPPPPGIYT